MAGLVPISDFLRRLTDALSPLWGGGRWRPEPSKADYDRALAASKEALDAVRGTRNWGAIPSLLGILTHGDVDLRNAAATVIAELAAFIPVASLPWFEGQVRSSTLRSYPWGELDAGWVTAQDWPARVWPMFTLHPSGYVREAALRRLVLTGDARVALPYLLLRVNDWVPEVRNVATDAVKSVLGTKQVAPWVPVLGLVEQLRHRSRADHAWLADEIASLFLLPEARPEFMDAARSNDRAVARWAFRVAMNLQPADRAVFIWLAAENSDPIVRLHAASAVRKWKECPGRDQLLQKMAADGFMPIRREAMYAALEGDPESRRTFLHAALLDHNTSMRYAARFYLRDASGGSFEAREFYLRVLPTADARTRSVAIAGVGECGGPADAADLVAHVADRRPSVAAAAVRAIASLDRERRIAWFVEVLDDERPGVAREACRALVPSSNAVPIASMRRILHSGKRDHSRRFALRVLLQRHPYDAVVEAISAAGSGDTAIAGTGASFIERVHPWLVSYGPSEAQKTAVLSALSELPQQLPENLRKRVGDFMGMVLA